jgi:hypothetical protein
MKRLVQILLLSPPAAIGGGQRAGGAEGLVLGLDEAGVLWTGRLSGTGASWSVQWTEVNDRAREAGEAAEKAKATEASERRP